MRYLELVLFLVYTDLRTEVARRFLGVLWWVLEPVMYMTVFYLIFEVGLRQGGPDYVPFLLCGMVSWKWFDGSIRQAANSIVANSGLIQQIFVPKSVFGVVQVLSNTFKFLVVLLLLLGFLLAKGHSASVHWWALVPLILVELLLIISLGLLLAALVPFAHDLRQVIDNLMMLMMFMSGIFIRPDSMPEHVQYYFYFNPMVGIIEGYREILLQNRWPDWGNLGYAICLSLPMLAAASLLLRRYERHYPKLLY